MRPARVGALIGAVGGALFLAINASAVPEPWPAYVRGAGVVSFLLVVWLVLRVPDDPHAYAPDARQLQAFWITVALEVVAIVGGAQLFIRVFDRPAATLPWVAIVLGVHWLVFHVVFARDVFVWLGWLTLTCGVVGMLVALTQAGPPESVAIVSGLFTGVVMLGCVGVDAARTRKALLRWKKT